MVGKCEEAMMEEDARTYKVFLAGELVDLCIPSELAIERDGWADWFNNIKRLGNTGHGIFPNYEATQREILAGLRQNERLVLLICNKENGRAFGVISLQDIDFVRRQAEIAMNIGNPSLNPLPRYASVEAMALITQHGFETMGLERIHAGQAYPSLKSWNRALELIGYRTEGLTRGTFRRGHEQSDTVLGFGLIRATM